MAAARTETLKALTRLSQAVSALDRGLQAIEVKDTPAAVRELSAFKTEFRRAE